MESDDKYTTDDQTRKERPVDEETAEEFTRSKKTMRTPPKSRNRNQDMLDTIPKSIKDMKIESTQEIHQVKLYFKCAPSRLKTNPAKKGKGAKKTLKIERPNVSYVEELLKKTGCKECTHEDCVYIDSSDIHYYCDVCKAKKRLGHH
ncbi:hypothetical protein ILUMI_08187 [Ignelater luminosus]|uniref:Uncharacterized protein n=1 Tax=Ignelater luminosus TaxID=2038154 RepID=A0A8K0GHA2_IGNLU|nr:hypothetical protein ILUMI_08187 [Ignelater luminosus]